MPILIFSPGANFGHHPVPLNFKVVFDVNEKMLNLKLFSGLPISVNIMKNIIWMTHTQKEQKAKKMVDLWNEFLLGMEKSRFVEF